MARVSDFFFRIQVLFLLLFFSAGGGGGGLE